MEEASGAGRGLGGGPGSDSSPSSSEASGGKGSGGLAGRPNRDPTSHRIIEKRRRDRMNNCLANLSKLIPSAFLKKGRGRVEKTEIIEMAIRYLRALHQEGRQASLPASDPKPTRQSKGEAEAEGQSGAWRPEEGKAAVEGWERSEEAAADGAPEAYSRGFQDCVAQTLGFLAAADGVPLGEELRGRLLADLNAFLLRLPAEKRPTPAQPGPCAAAAAPVPALEPAAPASQEPLNMSLKAAGGAGAAGTAEGRTEARAENWSSQYPSSPGSSRSFSDVSSGASSFPDSPPRVLSPPGPSQPPEARLVPVFALHSAGLFYVPLKVPWRALGAGAAQLSQPHPAPTPHPVTITVNFPHAQHAPPRPHFPEPSHSALHHPPALPQHIPFQPQSHA